MGQRRQYLYPRDAGHLRRGVHLRLRREVHLLCEERSDRRGVERRRRHLHRAELQVCAFFHIVEGLRSVREYACESQLRGGQRERVKDCIFRAGRDSGVLHLRRRYHCRCYRAVYCPHRQTCTAAAVVIRIVAVNVLYHGLRRGDSDLIH